MFNFELPADTTRIWDLHVPILQDRNITNVYLTNGIEDPSEYNELCFLLRAASPAEVFHFHINCPGGLIDSAMMIIDAMQSSSANIIGHLSGTVASAGTIIALHCKEIRIANYTSWMSHNYSGGIHGKGHEMKAYQSFTDSELNRAFTEIHTGFFTDDEIQQLIDGRDFWMGKDEILTRWNAKQGKPTKPKAIKA